MKENSALYFKRYRETIGFKNQNDAKDYLAGKDVTPNIDLKYIDALNSRVKGIIERLNGVTECFYKREDIDVFINEHVFNVYDKIQKAKLLPKLNNQGRRPEEVLFSWIRGYTISEYFTPAISRILSVNLKSITKIGDDDLSNIQTFKRSPKADLEIKKNNKRIRIEVQSGFQGINDIKEHKVREAHKVLAELKIKTICIHIDLFNGQVAFVQLDSIKDNDVNWVTRQQMEGQSVFTIDQNFFKWRLLDKLPKFNELEFDL